MFDKTFIQVDTDLFRRLVEAIERIAPPAQLEPQTPLSEDDVVDLTPEEQERVEIMGQLEDLIKGLEESGGNDEELARLKSFRGALKDEPIEGEGEDE